MRLAGDEQHAQVLANAFGCNNDAVVGGGQFAGRFVQFNLNNVLARVRERHINGDLLTNRRPHRLVWL